MLVHTYILEVKPGDVKKQSFSKPNVNYKSLRLLGNLILRVYKQSG